MSLIFFHTGWASLPTWLLIPNFLTSNFLTSDFLTSIFLTTNFLSIHCQARNPQLEFDVAQSKEEKIGRHHNHFCCERDRSPVSLLQYNHTLRNPLSWSDINFMSELKVCPAVFEAVPDGSFPQKWPGLQEGTRIETLPDLVRELHTVFSSSSVNVEKVHGLMSAYRSNPREWIRYAKFDRHRYTRNLLDEGNGRFNLMILAWAEGQGSSIHDHADSHCFMKVLDGSLREIRFAWPQDSDEEELDREMEMIGENDLKTNDVAYINDSIGLHRMENPSHTQTAVSLHLYCPPFESVQLFDQRTGHKTIGKVTFWSKYGKRTPFGSTTRKLEVGEYENN